MGTTPNEMIVSRSKSKPVASKSSDANGACVHGMRRNADCGGSGRPAFTKSSPQTELGGERVLLAFDHAERLLQALTGKWAEGSRLDEIIGLPPFSDLAGL